MAPSIRVLEDTPGRCKVEEGDRGAGIPCFRRHRPAA